MGAPAGKRGLRHLPSAARVQPAGAAGATRAAPLPGLSLVRRPSQPACAGGTSAVRPRRRVPVRERLPELSFAGAWIQSPVGQPPAPLNTGGGLSRRVLCATEIGGFRRGAAPHDTSTASSAGRRDHAHKGKIRRDPWRNVRANRPPGCLDGRSHGIRRQLRKCRHPALVVPAVRVRQGGRGRGYPGCRGAERNRQRDAFRPRQRHRPVRRLPGPERRLPAGDAIRVAAGIRRPESRARFPGCRAAGPKSRPLRRLAALPGNAAQRRPGRAIALLGNGNADAAR